VAVGREGSQGILSYIARAKTAGRESLLDVREEPRAVALRRSSDGIPSTERVVSSFFLSAPLFLPPLCIAVHPFSFATLTPLNLPHSPR